MHMHAYTETIYAQKNEYAYPALSANRDYFWQADDVLYNEM